MNKLSSQDRSSLIRLASSLPKGSKERRTILSGLKFASDVFIDFANFLKRNRPKIDEVQMDRSGPFSTTSTNTLRYTVDISEFIESLGDEGESAIDSLADALNNNPKVDLMVAEALGIKKSALVGYSGVHFRKSPADYEILDNNFYATTRQTILQN